MGQNLILYNRNGSRKFALNSRAKCSVVTSAKLKSELMKDDSVAVTINAAEPLDIAIGDFIVVFGRKYTINQLPQPAKEGLRQYTYNIPFEGAQYDLLDVYFHLPEDAIGDNYYCNAADLAKVLEWNLQRVFNDDWHVYIEEGAAAPDKYVNFTASGKNALAVLQELCSTFGLEFSITGDWNDRKVITITKRVGTSPVLSLQFGRGRGLYKLSRTNVSNAGITNRLYVYGGSENLGQNYPYNKLCLKGTGRLTSYLENNESVSAFGLREGSKTYSDIKPQRIGQVTDLGEDTITFADTTGDPEDPTNPPMFELNATDEQGNTLYLINGTAAKITFQTGNLAGYEFDLHSYDHQTKTFIINRITDENGLVIPSDDSAAFQFAVGDKYIITDIQLPQEYIDQAAAKLLEAASADFPTLAQPQVSYKLSLDPAFITAKWGRETAAEVLHPGDGIHITDAQIGVDKDIRITSITRDLLAVNSYELTLSDTTEQSVTLKVINDINSINEAISINTGFTNPTKARRRWMATQELLGMVFDPEGDYYSEKIKPLSIETQMLSVGAKSTQFALNNVTLQPNYNGDANTLYISAGTLVHYGIDPDATKVWEIRAVTYSGLIAAAPYYIYARCERNTTRAAIYLSKEPKGCESEAAYYNFLVGVLNSVSTDNHGGNPARLISLTYGSSTINGRFVRCGRIESSGGGATYFDLDTGTIAGAIQFISGDGTYKNVSSIETALTEAEKALANSLTDIQEQVDGKVEIYYQASDPATAWTDEATLLKHQGDQWHNTTDKTLFRFCAFEKWNGNYFTPRDGVGIQYVGNYTFYWARITDQSAIDAAAAAAAAQTTANGKTTVYVATPVPPYNVGDLWLKDIDANGVAAGGLWRCVTARTADEAFSPTDWCEATTYDSTQTVIDGGIVTAGTIQLAGATSGSIVAGITGGNGATLKETASTPESQRVRIWAGASESARTEAPFRVLENGRLYASDAVISGTVHATDGDFSGTINATNGTIGALAISGNDIIGLDGGEERVRIGLGALPSVSSAFKRQVLDFELTSPDGRVYGPLKNSAGLYDGHVSAPAYYYFDKTETLHQADTVTANFAFTIQTEPRSLIFQGIRPAVTIDQTDEFTPTAVPHATLYSKAADGTLTAVKSFFINGNAVLTDITAGDYVLQVMAVVSYGGEEWHGAVEVWINGGILIETPDTSASTTIAKDGLLVLRSALQYFLFNDDGLEVRFNNAGIRLTASGLQKLSNGNWVTL